MSLHDLLRSRRSIRRFGSEPIAVSTIERILTSATFAPSAHNRQPWRFVVLTSPSSKSNLADAMAADFRRDLTSDDIPPAEVEEKVETSRARISSAPVVILLCMDTSSMDVYSDPKRAQAERIMAIQSTANAGLALLLATQAEGLGSVWSCAPLFTPYTVQTVLELPKTWEPQAMFFIGSPAAEPRPQSRRPLSDVVIFK